MGPPEKETVPRPGVEFAGFETWVDVEHMLFELQPLNPGRDDWAMSGRWDYEDHKPVITELTITPSRYITEEDGETRIRTVFEYPSGGLTARKLTAEVHLGVASARLRRFVAMSARFAEDFGPPSDLEEGSDEWKIWWIADALAKHRDGVVKRSRGRDPTSDADLAEWAQQYLAFANVRLYGAVTRLTEAWRVARQTTNSRLKRLRDGEWLAPAQPGVGTPAAGPRLGAHLQDHPEEVLDVTAYLQEHPEEE